MPVTQSIIGGYGKSISRENLIFYVDAAMSQSYPGSGTTWTDLSGGNFNGTMTNLTYNNVGTMAFNGTSSKVVSNIPTTAITNVSIMVWANLTTNTKGCLFKVGSGTHGYAIGIGSPTTEFDGNGSEILGLFSAIRWIYTGQTFTTGWHMLTMTLGAASVCQIYYDTTAINTPTGSAPLTPTTSISLGECTGDLGSGRYFSGNIAMAAMYSKTLTQSEVNQNFNAMRGRFGV